MDDFKKVKIFASCHNHSNYSDAEYSPEKLAEIAKGLGHGGIILTDHDTVSGTYFMNKAARKLGLKSILGCEFSTYFEGRGVHLCGFDFNPDNAKMRDLLARGSGVQTARSELMFKWGLERGTLREGITWQDVRDDFPYNDYICNNQVFVSYLKRGIYKPEEYETFVKTNFSYKLGLEDKIREITGLSYKDIHTEEVIKIIRDAGGVPVVAHPTVLSDVAEKLVDLGVMGFETRHAAYRPDKRENAEELFKFYETLCEEKNLYKMGGSDHEGDLGGLLEFGDEYACPDYLTGVTEENFMKLYERRLG